MPRSRNRRSGFWSSSRRGSGRRGMFGGRIKTEEEVKRLNKKITHHERREFEVFEKQFDEELNNIE